MREKGLLNGTLVKMWLELTPANDRELLVTVRIFRPTPRQELEVSGLLGVALSVVIQDRFELRDEE